MSRQHPRHHTRSHCYRVLAAHIRDPDGFRGCPEPLSDSLPRVKELTIQAEASDFILRRARNPEDTVRVLARVQHRLPWLDCPLLAKFHIVFCSIHPQQTEFSHLTTLVLQRTLIYGQSHLHDIASLCPQLVELELRDVVWTNSSYTARRSQAPIPVIRKLTISHVRDRTTVLLGVQVGDLGFRSKGARVVYLPLRQTDQRSGKTGSNE